MHDNERELGAVAPDNHAGHIRGRLLQPICHLCSSLAGLAEQALRFPVLAAGRVDPAEIALHSDLGRRRAEVTMKRFSAPDGTLRLQRRRKRDLTRYATK